MDSAPSTSGAPARVTLSLGHLPHKKDVRNPWPRTPTRVHICAQYVLLRDRLPFFPLPILLVFVLRVNVSVTSPVQTRLRMVRLRRLTDFVW